jgi:hypothetical protein
MSTTITLDGSNYSINRKYEIKPTLRINDRSGVQSGRKIFCADWSSDVNTVYIVSADKKSVSLWSMN